MKTMIIDKEQDDFVLDPVGHLIQYGYLKPQAVEGEGDKTDAIVLYQTNFLEEIKEFDPEFTITGELDEPTIKHMELPRCHVKDIDPEILFLGGSGSFPKGCHGSGEFHQVNIYFDFSGMPSWWVPVFDEVFDLVNAAYSDMGIRLNRVTVKSQANITVTWTRGSGWIGLAIVGRGQSCSTQIWAKFDNRYGSSYSTPQLINQLAVLLAHEFGHNMGMSHARNGIMKATLSNAKFTKTAWRGDDQESFMTRSFGGVPFPITPPDPPPIPIPWFL